MTLHQAQALDAADPLARYRDLFDLPDGVIYLDGNSLGALPKSVPAAIADATTRQWGDRLIRSWNEGWIDAPQRLGKRIAPLVGAAGHEVIVGDSTSTHLFKLIVAALRTNPHRHTVVSERGNFPTDLHVAEGAVACVPGARLHAVPREDLASAIDEDTALVMLTHVHYKTADRFDMAAWTKTAHDAGAMILWDLSHSVGAIPLDLTAANADMAVGCTYKYLNGGPGAPAFVYVADRHQAALANPISGWMGHAAPFAFEDGYRPADGMKRWLVGTPPILSMAALDAALGVWREIDHSDIAAKSAQLFTILADAGDALGLACVSPRDPARRGSHISFRHPHAYAITQALIARGVIGDFRDPDILRLGLTPLYLSHEDVWRAGDILTDIMTSGAWQDPAYSERLAVT